MKMIHTHKSRIKKQEREEEDTVDAKTKINKNKLRHGFVKWIRDQEFVWQNESWDIKQKQMNFILVFSNDV